MGKTTRRAASTRSGPKGMRITRFVVEDTPDDDGVYPEDVRLAIANPAKVDVQLVTTHSVCRNVAGAVLTVTEQEHEVSLRPMQQIERPLRLDEPWKGQWLMGCGNGLSLEVVAVLQSRTVLALGEAAVPEHVWGGKLLQGEIRSDYLAPHVKVLVSRGNEDKDGVVHVDYRCGVVNAGAAMLYKVFLQTELRDAGGICISVSRTAPARVEPGMPWLLAGGMYVKAAQLHGASFRADLIVFEPVATLTAHAEETEDEDLEELAAEALRDHAEGRTTLL